MEVVLILAGRGRHRTIYGQSELRAGDAFALRPGVWHAYHDCRNLDVYNCCFGVELLRRELAWMLHDPLLGALCWPGSRAGDRPGVTLVRLQKPALMRCREHLDNLAQLTDPSRHAERIGRLTMFLGEVARHLKPIRSSGKADDLHPSVVEAIKRMEDDPRREWTLGPLAKELRIAEAYLVRRFKRATGLPPMAWLARLRAERAAAMLLRTDEPVAQIGSAVGWDDPNYFARRFRAHFGLSASAYRDRFSGDKSSD
jgi:AraC family L-rhamnose operon transcriptional activator RhaR